MSMNRRKFFGILPGLLATKEIAAELAKPAVPGAAGTTFPIAPPRPHEIWDRFDPQSGAREMLYIIGVDPYKEGDPFVCSVTMIHDSGKPIIANVRGFTRLMSARSEYYPGIDPV